MFSALSLAGEAQTSLFFKNTQNEDSIERQQMTLQNMPLSQRVSHLLSSTLGPTPP